MFTTTKIAYFYWPIECTSKLQFIQMFQVIKITYIYCPIECIWRLQFITLLTIERIDFIYWKIDDIKKLQFVRLLSIAIVAYIYWPIECTSKLQFIQMYKITKLLTSIDQLTSLQNINLSKCMKLQKLPLSLTKWHQYFDLFTCFKYQELQSISNHMMPILWFVHMFQLPRVANIYWPFELALAHFNLWRHFGF
jgi:hypothetical protein